MKKAQEYHLTQIEYECARIMARFHHEQQNYRDFVMYRNLCERLEQRRVAEDRSERLYQEVVSTYHKSKANRHNALKLAHQHRQTVLSDWQKFKSTAIETHLLKIQTFEKQLQNDYPEVLQLLNKHERLLMLHSSYCAPAQLMEMQVEKMNVFVQLRHFPEGQQYAQQLENFAEGTLPWFQLQVLSVLLALHSGQYEAAAQVFKVVLEQATFRNLDNLDKNKWLTFQAYLHYLYRNDKRREIRPLIQNTKLNFKLSEFVDDRPPFDKERRGLNISILAIQALYYLERHDTLGVGDCIQALLPYCRRYPKKDEYYRSECFINLLQLMQQENFRFYHTRKATEKIVQEMENTPLELQTQNLFLEILPFEQIWERMMEKLKEIKYS
ncbi:MAG: hypothetical protein HC913_19595 [Microscillaceae bacterium]|nr:hypothetical protein [Microscillaceae bacterium]